jgi:hypothetical protein
VVDDVVPVKHIAGLPSAQPHDLTPLTLRQGESRARQCGGGRARAFPRDGRVDGRVAVTRRGNGLTELLRTQHLYASPRTIIGFSLLMPTGMSDNRSVFAPNLAAAARKRRYSSGSACLLSDVPPLGTLSPESTTPSGAQSFTAFRDPARRTVCAGGLGRAETQPAMVTARTIRRARIAK